MLCGGWVTDGAEERGVKYQRGGHAADTIVRRPEVTRAASRASSRLQGRARAGGEPLGGGQPEWDLVGGALGFVVVGGLMALVVVLVVFRGRASRCSRRHGGSGRQRLRRSAAPGPGSVRERAAGLGSRWARAGHPGAVPRPTSAACPPGYDQGFAAEKVATTL